MSTDIKFKSYVAKQMSQFVKTKQLSGFDYRSSAYLLRQFDLFLCKKAKTKGISKKKR